MKRLAVALMVAAAFMLVTATAVQAVSVPKATGSIVMSSPKQAIDFAVFETNPVKGELTYTNFEYADPGSGVWVPGTFDVGFYLAPFGGPFTHSLTTTGFTPLSPTAVEFHGTGFYAPNPSWTETFTGSIHGSHLELTLVPDDGGALYQWTWTSVSGTIAPEGSVSGTWNDSLLRSDVFTIADVGDEVLSYTTSPTCVQVKDDESGKARFGFTIPAGSPLAGTHVVVKVIDGGSPGAVYDTYKHTVADGPNSCDPLYPYTVYPITAGNLTVFA